MNSLVAIVTLILLFQLYGKRFKISKLDLYLFVLGASLPMVDYWVAFQLKMPSLALAPQFFHSFIYQLGLWSLLALFHWVWFRNGERALHFYRPIGGLALYAFFATFSTEERNFFHPLSDATLSFGWVLSGYFFPLLIMGLAYFARHWIGIVNERLSKTLLLILFGFTLFQGLLKGVVYIARPDVMTQEGALTLRPLNLPQYNWNLTLQRENDYLATRFFLLGGFEEEPVKIPISNEPEILRSQLMEPDLRRIYFKDFQAPIAELKFQHENLEVLITEMEPRQELIWIEKISFYKNRTGQNLEINPQYGSFF